MEELSKLQKEVSKNCYLEQFSEKLSVELVSGGHKEMSSILAGQ